MLYYAPWQEFTLPNRGLVESGQLFDYDLHSRNDDKMVSLSMLVPARQHRRKYAQRCIGCGKHFISRQYLDLHRMYGCGRHNLQYHTNWLEEPDRYGRELHLLGVRQ